MSKFHSLKIAEINKETADCVSITFDVPKELEAEYKYIPGQYLTLKTVLGGEELRRSYSICSAPFDNKLTVAVKAVPNGKFSTYANNDLAAGQAIDVMTPMGNFVPKIDPTHEKNYVLFAAGSGITPIMSIIKTILKEEPKSNVTLFYGNRGFKSIIFREEIEGIKNTYLDRFSVHHILSRENIGSKLYTGRINTEKCKELQETLLDFSTIDEAFLCGPEEMIKDVSDFMKNAGVDESKIHFELFTTFLSKEKHVLEQPGTDKDSTKEEFESMITLIIDTVEYKFPLLSNHESILDAAINRGADVPYACKGGVCCTCRAKLTEGEVNMDVNFALEPHEIEQGYVLTCQSHPKTKSVTVNFDL